MAKESPFVAVAQAVAEEILKPPLSVHRGAALLYEIVVDNTLSLTVDLKRPRRGESAFQTDLCVFETKSEGVTIPRVVLEFKTSITTHDVLTYSAKARKHKQVYPYLRYGVVASAIATVPRRFFVHNESLDFFAALGATNKRDLREFFSRLLQAEISSSRSLENIAFGKHRTHIFRSEIQLNSL